MAPSLKEIEVTDLFRLQESASQVTVIDVREIDEYREVHAPETRNIPLSLLASGDFSALENTPRGEALYVLCRSGARSQKACGLLTALGFEQPVNVKGGMMAWQASGLPIKKG